MEQRKQRRINISVSPTLFRKIEAYCERTGISKSSLGAVALAQFIDSRELVEGKIGDFLKQLEGQIRDK